MKILVLTQNYPKKDDLYKNNFVHTRLKKYLSSMQNLEIEVFVLKPIVNQFDYEYEGIKVHEGDENVLNHFLLTEEYDKIVIHFLVRKMIAPLLENAQDIPKLIWVHGFEALHWKRRLFNMNSKDFFRYTLTNILQLKEFKKYDMNQKNSKYIFVSEWMKDIASKDIGAEFKDYYIIANGIDTDKYFFEEKKNNSAKKILMIRPFNSRKYATDIATKSIFEFSKDPTFKDFEFTIVGEGKYFNKDTEKIAHFPNVNLVNRFLTPDEIKEFHSKNGVFLCPTRQDAQGVSMCEAMSSGLIPITSNNTAIPEFVENNVSGYLTSGVKDIVSIFKKISKDELPISTLSKNAREKIEEKCDLNEINHEELQLILN